MGQVKLKMGQVKLKMGRVGLSLPIFKLKEGRVKLKEGRVKLSLPLAGIGCQANHQIPFPYFLKIKNTAPTKQANPAKWFHLKVSVLNNAREKIVNTTSVMTS